MFKREVISCSSRFPSRPKIEKSYTCLFSYGQPWCLCNIAVNCAYIICQFYCLHSIYLFFNWNLIEFYGNKNNSNFHTSKSLKWRTNDSQFFSFFSVHDNSDILYDLSQKLIEQFHYPYEMMPLVYVILKYAKGDVEEASRELYEGNASTFADCSLHAFTDLWFTICFEYWSL